MNALHTAVTVNRKFTEGTVDDRLFGGFIEHIGRCVYTGLYEPGHHAADADGFRTDVLELVRELQMPIMRYPGGCFVSGYDWHNGVGPQNRRPTVCNYVWKSKETNQFGVDEFAKWCVKAGCEPLMAVNLATGSIASAQELVEYCNVPGGTKWSEERRKNGADDPYNIRVWCLGNEMDAPWSVCRMRAEDYGRLANEAGKVMKSTSPDIELVVCGSSTREMPEFGSWDYKVLRESFDTVDYLSVHAYFKNYGNYGDFLASAEVLDRQLDDMIAVCDSVAAEKKSAKKIMLALDEWNTWSRANSEDPATVGEIIRYQNEEVYDVADALTVGGLLMSMLDHADRLKIGCLAQVVNVLAPIMTRPGGPAWRQTSFYPIALTSRYGRGTVLRKMQSGPDYRSEWVKGAIPVLRTAVVWRKAEKELVIFALNRSLTAEHTAEFSLENFIPERIAEAVELHHGKLDAANTEKYTSLVPQAMDASRLRLDGNTLCVTLKAASWNMIRIPLK